MQNLLLKHGREQQKLTPQKIEAKTGIPARRYEAYEAARLLIDAADAELLGSALQLKPEYLKEYSLQLELLLYRKELERLKDEKIAVLAKALKKRLKAAPEKKTATRK